MAKAPTALPDPGTLGTAIANANVSDFRAIMIVLVFVIIALMAFIVWRELNLASLIRSLNKVSEALGALRLTLVEDRILQREATALRLTERERDRDERQQVRDERRGSPP